MFVSVMGIMDEYYARLFFGESINKTTTVMGNKIELSEKVYKKMKALYDEAGRDIEKFIRYFFDNGFYIGSLPVAESEDVPQEVPEVGDVTVEYFLNKESLGRFPITSMSTVKDRDSVAEHHGIKVYDRCVCRTYPSGTGTDFKKVGGMFMDDDGNFWVRKHITGKKKK